MPCLPLSYSIAKLWSDSNIAGQRLGTPDQPEDIILVLFELQYFHVIFPLDGDTILMQATTADYANKLYTTPTVANSSRFSKPKLSQTAFTIDHYAGEVHLQLHAHESRIYAPSRPTLHQTHGLGCCKAGYCIDSDLLDSQHQA